MGEVPENEKKAKIPPIFKKGRKECLGRNRLVSLTSVPEKMMEQLMLEVVASLVKDKEVTGNSQHGFTKKR